MDFDCDIRKDNIIADELEQEKRDYYQEAIDIMLEKTMLLPTVRHLEAMYNELTRVEIELDRIRGKSN